MVDAWSGTNIKRMIEDEPELYGVRRSGRSRNTRYADLDSDSSSDDAITAHSHRKKKTSSSDDATSHSSKSSEDSDSSTASSDFSGRQKTTRKRRYVEQRNQSVRSLGKSVNYAEHDTQDDDDLLDDDAMIPMEVAPDAPTEAIDKVLDHRVRRKGATGSHTTIYNVEDSKDPNAGFDATTERGEVHYLIKWASWSHFHNTWESELTLMELKVGGMRKLENYMKRLELIRKWQKRASPEDVEFMDLQREMECQLYSQYQRVERVVAEQQPKDKDPAVLHDYPEYLCKWEGLPYSECTWEDGELIDRKFTKILNRYYSFIQKFKAGKTPKRNGMRSRHRSVVPEKFLQQPEYLAGGDPEFQLRDYQLDGLNWLIFSWWKSRSVMLADEMGLGKTIQTISFLSYLHNTQNIHGPFLLIVPLSTIVAWQRETEAWAPEFYAVTYLGDVKSRSMIRQQDWQWQKRSRLKFNILLTTYEILMKDKAYLAQIDWAVMAIDEAHRLKNEDSVLYKMLATFSADFRLLITGTPLQNSLRELWSLLHFILPSTFETWEDFEKKYACQSNDAGTYAALHEDLKLYLLRRVKKDVEKSLPSKVERILRVGMSKRQKQYYKYILARNYEELIRPGSNVSSLVNIIMELKKCSNHGWLIQPEEGDVAAMLQGSGKLMLLEQLLTRLKEGGHRVLIFSQMVRMLDILARYLQLRRYPYQRLDGSISAQNRKQAIDHFNAEGSLDFCFLLSTRAGGLGVNLATADTVIIFDSDWNPQNDLQAQARAHRIGQKKQVSVYRLVTKDSVEETILERAKQKMVLDHLVIQRMDTTGRTVLDKTSSSAQPFDSGQLSAILKFGAATLFTDPAVQNEEETKVDIDDIMSRAEAQDSQQPDNEFLAQFKVVDLAFQESNWSELIPETLRQNAGAALPAVASAEPMPDEADSSGEEDKKQPKFYGLTQNQLRNFIRSFQKFPDPPNTLEALGADADLEDLPLSKLKSLCESLASKTRQNSEKKSFAFGNIQIVPKRILSCMEKWNNLNEFITSNATEFTFKAAPPHRWHAEWSDCDDIALLRGISRHGMSNWDEIQLDEELGLVAKILEENGARPQTKDLESRVNYLLRCLQSPPEGGGDSSSEAAADPPSSDEKKKPRKTVKTTRRRKKQKEPPKKRGRRGKKKDISDSDECDENSFAGPAWRPPKKGEVEDNVKVPEQIEEVVEEEKLGPDVFDQCKLLLKPIRKQLRKLDSSEDFLRAVGEHIECCLAETETGRKALKTNLWRFTAQFSTQSADQLHKQFRRLGKTTAKKISGVSRAVPAQEQKPVTTEERTRRVATEQNESFHSPLSFRARSQHLQWGNNSGYSNRPLGGRFGDSSSGWRDSQRDISDRDRPRDSSDRKSSRRDRERPSDRSGEGNWQRSRWS